MNRKKFLFDEPRKQACAYSSGQIVWLRVVSRGVLIGEAKDRLSIIRKYADATCSGQTPNQLHEQVGSWPNNILCFINKDVLDSREIFTESLLSLLSRVVRSMILGSYPPRTRTESGSNP